MSGPDWIGTILLTFRHELSLTGAGNLFPLLFVGLMAAWVILSSIPAFLLSAADEGTIQMIEPAQARPHDASSSRLSADWRAPSCSP